MLRHALSRWRRADRLERRLREGRPVPPHTLLDELVGRIEASNPPTRSLKRLGPVGVAAATMLVVFAVFGGIGLAASGISGAASSTASAVATFASVGGNSGQSASNNQGNGNQGNGNSGNGNGNNGNGNNDDECEDGDDGGGAAEAQYCKPRKTICHKGKNTLTLPIQAAEAHLRNHQGDYEGPCRL